MKQFTLFDTIESHISRFESGLYTATPAIVETYDSETATISCYPAIYKADKDGVLLQESLLEGVPVMFPSTKDAAITFPLTKGDKVMLLFGQQDMDTWLESAEDIDKPQTLRRHNLNDAVAYPTTLKYNSGVVKTGAEEGFNVQFKDSNVYIDPDGGVDIKAGKFSVTNDTGELVAWISELLQILEATTVNTVYGVSPLNTKAQIASLRAELDTIKR